MSLQRLNRRTVWMLLPLLLARLLVPDGFMVSTSDQGVGMAMCSGFAPLPAPDSAPAHPGPEKPQCPFALTGMGFASLPVAVAGPWYVHVDNLSIANTAPARVSPAVLIDRIRGPPLT